MLRVSSEELRLSEINRITLLEVKVLDECARI